MARYQTRTISAILNLSDAANQALAQSALWFGRCHLKNFNLRCRNGTNLAVLNLHVSPIPPTKFQLNLTYHLGADVVSRWPLQRPSWISERNDFRHSESLCCSDASHQVSAQSDLWFGRRCRLKIFKMDMATILDIRME